MFRNKVYFRVNHFNTRDYSVRGGESQVPKDLGLSFILFVLEDHRTPTSLDDCRWDFSTNDQRLKRVEECGLGMW